MVSINRSLQKFITSIPFKPTHKNMSSCSNSLQLLRTSKLFNGEQRYYKHHSDILNTDMEFGIYLPPRIVCDGKPCPVLYFLNGLEGNCETFFQKSSFGRCAAKLGICVVSPDTSTSDVNDRPPDMIKEGSSFCVDATQKPWSQNFRIFTYVTKELVSMVTNNFDVIKDKQSISGFSMGGYGALICFLKNPGLYQSCSTFGAVCNPLKSEIGRQFLEVFFGEHEEEKKNWDPTELTKNYDGEAIEILLDQGTADEYATTLLPQNLIRISKENNCVQVIFKYRKGYSHNYFYITTFIDEHMAYHASYLNSNDAC